MISGISDNERVSAIWSAEDVTLSGDNHNRHSDYRELLFEVNPCKADSATGKTCLADSEAELAKMEIIVLYNTKSFDKRDNSKDPIRREAIIEHFNFNPGKSYDLEARIQQGVVEENRGLLRKNEATFYELQLG